MKRSWFILLWMGIVISCVDPVNLPIRSTASLLVIDGQVTNEAPPYTVRLSYSGTFAFDQEAPQDQKVTDALVTLSDDAGHSTAMLHNPTNPGYYQSTDSSFVGQPGRSYTLTVQLANGQVYHSAPETMPVVPPVDSLTVQFTKTGNMVMPYEYYFYVATSDPGVQKNYYRWTAYTYTAQRSTGVPCCIGCPSICFDRCWSQFFSQDISILSDNGIDGNPIRHQLVMRSPIYTQGPTLAEVQQFSLTQSAYQFWKSFREQQSRTGTIFDPLPASIVGNITNTANPDDHALGYFSASAITRKRLRVTGTETYETAVYGYITSLLVPQGDCRYTYGLNSPVVEPEGWQ